MATVGTSMFDSKWREAPAGGVGDKQAMIRSVMNRADWAILLTLAVIWGGAFFFISVAVREVPPFTYVWLRLSFAALALWAYVWWRGGGSGLPGWAWRSILL